MFKRIILLVVLTFGLWGCGDRLDARLVTDLNPESQPIATQALTEVAAPSLINELRTELDQYQPQLKILSPRPDETFNSTTIDVQLQVNDLPLFKDEELGMGPHIHLFVDDQPYMAVYDTSQPITLENLSPGSHLLRAFASRPWHESFKNEGAYAETTFNIFTKSNNNIPDFQQPLLTYSRPQGTYGAEPIMLDFYLTNAPLHFVAQADATDNINDWRIRVTINGESFILDNWQPIYLEGFKKGENWIKLEFIDDQGELLENTYNSPVRVINYDPKLNDTLAKLVQNKLPLRTAKRLVTRKPLPPEAEAKEPASQVEPTANPETEKSPVSETETAPSETLPTSPETPVAEPSEPAIAPEVPETESASEAEATESIEAPQTSVPTELTTDNQPQLTPEPEASPPAVAPEAVEPSSPTDTPETPAAAAETVPEPEVNEPSAAPGSEVAPGTEFPMESVETPATPDRQGLTE